MPQRKCVHETSKYTCEPETGCSDSTGLTATEIQQRKVDMGKEEGLLRQRKSNHDVSYNAVC